MIVFREKLFRRDNLTDEAYMDLEDKPELVRKYGKSKIIISATKQYNNQMKLFGPAIDKFRIKSLLKDIKTGHIVNDGPAGGDTHYLGDYSKIGKYHTFSKSIDDQHRLNIRVHCPCEGINPYTKQKEHIKLIELESCWEHNTREGDYLNDKDLRERKDRMRGNAPYRNKTSILSKKKHGNNRTNTKRT